MSIAAQFDPAGKPYDEVYASLRQAREEAPVFYSERYKVWVVTRYDDIIRVLRDENLTVKGSLEAVQDGGYCPEARAVLAKGVDWMTTKHVASDDGPDHARFRNALRSVLTSKRFNGLEPTIRETAVGLIEGFRARGRCEFVSEYAYPLAMLTTLNLVGFDEARQDMDRLRIWITDTFKMLLAAMTPEEQVSAATNAVAFQDYIRAHIARRRANPTDDLMSEILDNLATGKAQLSEDELVIMFTHSFVGAGQETTKLAMTNMMFQLLSRRERWEDARANPGRAEAFIDECLRLDPPLMVWFRVAAGDTEIGGTRIGKGERVAMVLGSANHDEAKFPDSESFCPFREGAPPSLTFSSGKHFCVGAPLARLELKVTLEEFMRRLPNVRLKPGQTFDYLPNLGHRALPQLELEWD
ncbi:MAG: cytochrome P450 [Sphingomonadales bacterium]